MDLISCVKQVAKCPKNFTVQFWDAAAGHDDALYPTTINVVKLYKDWYGNADACPENGELIYGVTLSNEETGAVFMPELSTPFEFTFEDLMRVIEDVCGFR